MASLVKSLSVKSFGMINDRTDTYLILNVQSCGLQLEPCLDLMAPETVPHGVPCHANPLQKHTE